MTVFKPPTPVPISSGSGGGGGTAIINSSSSVTVTTDSETGTGQVNITTNRIVALSVDNNQNVIIGDSSITPTGRLTVSTPLGQCVQLINTTNNLSANLNVNSDGGLTIATSGSNIQLGSNKVYMGTGALCIGNTPVTSTATQLNYTATTPGIAVALKALVVDSNRDIANINSLSAAILTGVLQTASQPNITLLNSVNISTLSLGGYSVQSTALELNYLHNAVPGIAKPLKAVVLDSNMNFTEINSLQATSLTGTIQTPSQPNITSVGTLNSLLVSGFIGIGTSTPSRSLDIFASTPSIRLSNGTYNAELLIDSNGNLKINPTQDIAISSHTDILFSGTSSISGLSSLIASTLTGVIQTSSQPNITSLGPLSSLNVSGDTVIGSSTVQSGSFRLIIKEPSGQCLTLFRSSSLGCNLTINTFGDLIIDPTGDVRILSGKTLRMAGPIIGVSDLTAVTLTGTIQTAAQPNITSIGTLLSLNVTNGIVASTVSASTLTGVIQTASQPNIISVGTLSSLSVTNGITASSVSASSLTGVIQTSYQPNITSIGTLSSLTVTNSISASSISASTLTGTIQTASQPNITSIGTLSSFSVTNGITASSLVAASLTGVLQTASQTNITSIGTLSSLSVTNGITASSLIAATLTGVIQTTSQPNITSIGTLSSLNVTNGITASSLAAVSLTGVIQTASQPNITSVGVLNKLLISGPIGIGISPPSCAIDINTSVLSIDPAIRLSNGTIEASLSIVSFGLTISTNGDYVSLGTGVGLKFIGGTISGLTSLTATKLFGTLQTSAQPNITSVGTLSYLDSGYIGLGVTHNNQYRLNILDTNGKMIMMSDGSNALFLAIVNNDYTINTSTNRLALGSDVSLVLNGGTIIGLNTLTANAISGVIQTADQPNITSLGSLSALNVNGAIGGGSINISGSARIGGNLTVDGSLLLSTPLSFSNLSSTTAIFNADIATVSSTNGGTITVTGGAAFSKNVIIGTNLTVNGSVLTSASIDLLSGITPGVVSPGILVAANSSKNLTGFNCLTSTSLKGTIKTAYQPYITTVGNLDNLNVNGYLGVGTSSPIKQIEINSTTGDCLRLSNNKASITAYMDISIDTSGNSLLTPSGGTTTFNSKVVTQQIALGNTTCTTMPLEVGFVPFTMTQPYAYNARSTGHGVITPTGTLTSYSYSIRAQGRILCSQSIDVMSDKRTKKNIVELTDEFCTLFVGQTTPVSFNWIKGDDNKSFGYIAQELIRAGFPDLVNLTRDDEVEEVIDEDGFINPAGVKFTVTYQHIIPILAKNQKRLMRENAELKAKLDNILDLLQRR